MTGMTARKTGLVDGHRDLVGDGAFPAVCIHGLDEIMVGFSVARPVIGVGGCRNADAIARNRRPRGCGKRYSRPR